MGNKKKMGRPRLPARLRKVKLELSIRQGDLDTVKRAARAAGHKGDVRPYLVEKLVTDAIEGLRRGDEAA